MNTRQQKQQGVYDVLEWLEKERSQEIRSFWSCVFEDHIMQMYPTLHLLKKSLLDDGHYEFYYYETIEAHLAFLKYGGIFSDFLGLFFFGLVIGFSEELLGSEKSQMEANERMQNKEKHRNADDDSSEDSGDPGPSSASTSTLKKPANKPSFCESLRFTLCLLVLDIIFI